MSVTIEELRAAGELGALDLQFARALSRLADERRPDVLLAAAMASQHVSKGDVCLELASLCGSQSGAGARWPELEAWLDVLRTSPLVSDGSTATPLVLDPAGRLYLRRYWQHERGLAESLSLRASIAVQDLNLDQLEAGLERLFGSPRTSEPDLQREAARMAIHRRFSVVSGGPGTGKTYTVVKILALLVEQALSAGLPPPRMTLTAPTGKAAARLSESIKRAKATLDCSDEVRDAIEEDATTIHRALGSIGGSSTRFRHHERSALVTDLVLVDEASMVNLTLMARLVAAVPAHARLILLGDKDQLASVEAGSVLGDLCNTGGGGRPPDGLPAQESGIWDCVIHLEQSHRYAPGSGIEALALAINAGDAAAALEVLRSADYPDVSLFAPSKAGSLSDALAQSVLAGYGHYLGPPAAALRPFERLAAFGKMRVLCGHRSGTRGVVALNQQIRELLRSRGALEGYGDLYVGRPVMVGVNSYPLRLFNGDIGLVLPNPEGDGLRAFFGASEESQRVFAPSRLPEHETVFAMSVHKSQGSEFDEVAVVLPDRASPILTRELLYTAVTRAKERVAIHASPEVLAQAIGQRVERRSGLRSALWS